MHRQWIAPTFKKLGWKSWTEVAGQTFSQEEAMDADDMDRVCSLYGVLIEDFFSELDWSELRAGQRLWAIVRLPSDALGAALLAEEDERLRAVAESKADEELGEWAEVFAKQEE